MRSPAAASTPPWMSVLPEVPALDIPLTLEAWQDRRLEIRATLKQLLGEMPPRVSTTSITTRMEQQDEGFRRERIEFDNGAGETVSGYCLIPDGVSAQTPAPAILYCHWHGEAYELGKDEMMGTHAAPVAPGPALARLGFIVLGIDAPGFGERCTNTELAAAKYHLWFGRTLWGMTLRDDLTALDYLCSRPDVKADRIGVTGMSMGSTRAWWIMAMDDRPRAASCVACMTRYQALINAGKLNAHGIYYYVPGILRHFDTEAIMALAAPRAMLFQTGDQDDGSPANGVHELNSILSQIYALQGPAAEGKFQSLLYPGAGHIYLPEMWERTVQWLQKHLNLA
jgi:dienelactone hydrolase